MTEISNDSGWRGSQEVWLQAAYEALLETGVESVKILPLGKKLNLSRTSFYWFFKDREELLAGLVSRWRDKNTGSIVKQSEAEESHRQERILPLAEHQRAERRGKCDQNRAAVLEDSGQDRGGEKQA